MYIVDFGVFEPAPNLQQPGTGKVWVVSHGKSGIVLGHRVTEPLGTNRETKKQKLKTQRFLFIFSFSF